MQLALGTAQFGLDYGISNQTGRVSHAEAATILAEAARLGIRMLDTAPAYGPSEEVVGALSATQGDFQIVGKTLAVGFEEIGPQHLDDFREALDQTVGYFGGGPLYGILIHHGTDALKKGGGALLEILADYQRGGQVQRIGLSVDRVEELDDLLGHFDFEIVQVPLNILNQKLITDGYVGRLKARNVEIHARSLFLQGLFFLDPDQLPETLRGAAAPLGRVQALARETGIDICTLAIGYAKNQPGIDFGVVGVTAAGELIEIHSAWQRAGTDQAMAGLDYSSLAISDPVVITPSLWPEQR